MKIFRTTALILTLNFLLTSATALAFEEEIRNFRGIRSEGMGGLLTTTGNYSEALFGNPARHSEVDVSKFTMLESMVESNTTFLSTSGDVAKLKSASGAGTIASASNLIGQTEHLLLQEMVAYYNPNFAGDFGFAFGMLAAVHTNLAVNYTTDIDTQTIIDAGPNFGLSHSFLDGALSLGVNIHMLYRAGADTTISSISLLSGGKLSLQSFGKQGIGIDSDIGGYYHIPWEIPFMRISLGASINGLFKSHYDAVPVTLLTGLGNRPVNNDRLFNAGARFDFPDWWWFTAPLFAIEVQDTGDAQKRISFIKKLHMGAEGKLSRVFSLRMGLNQGYPTMGLGIDLPVVKIDFSTYGEELAGNAGQQEDRRLAMRLAFEL